MGTSYLSSPDEPSRVYPERLIRPLPKRTIRSRLSEEAADSIAYPPNPPSTSLPAYSHYDYEHDHDSYQDEDEHDHDCPHHHHHHHCHHHDEDEDDIDSGEDASPTAQRQSNAYRASPRSPRSSRHARHGSYGGKGSSVPDSYEAFENTNNKKKRKIPTSGSLNFHQSSLNAGMAQMGLGSLKDGDENLAGSYLPSSSSSGMGAQGIGRARGGKKSTSRNPLGISVNGSNIRNGTNKYDHNALSNPSADEPKTDQGIISKAIANATTLLRNPLGKGQENIGVLDQQTKTTPTNSQFTFTCESEAKGVKFPEQSLYSPDYAQRVNAASSATGGMPNQKFATQGTQTSPNAAAGQQASAAQQSHMPGGVGPNGQKQKPRRRKGDVYALAARQRKLQQEYTNLQHPPTPEDIWICEFCEYESIFGSQPYALVRQYEIKDRRERKRLAEKRRLLEKAKMKGRKGKKQTKNAAKAANSASQHPMNQQAYDQQQLDQMDDYLDDGYDDDPIPMPVPPPQAPAKQTMPGSYNPAAGKTSIDTGPDGGGGTVR